MKKLLKEPNFYFCIAIAVMVIIFISSSQTYEQQSQIGLLSRILKNEPLKDWLETISFSYAGRSTTPSKNCSTWIDIMM